MPDERVHDEAATTFLGVGLGAANDVASIQASSSNSSAVNINSNLIQVSTL
jgi:hypothetical protein